MYAVLCNIAIMRKILMIPFVPTTSRLQLSLFQKVLMTFIAVLSPDRGKARLKRLPEWGTLGTPSVLNAESFARTHNEINRIRMTSNHQLAELAVASFGKTNQEQKPAS